MSQIGPDEITVVSAKVLILIAIPIVAVAGIAAFFLLGGLRPPVDVYARPTPPATTTPASLLPASVAGFTRSNVETNTYTNAVDALATYGNEIRIEITQFASVGDAVAYVDDEYGKLSDGSKARFRSGDQDWFTFTHGPSGESAFVWRKGVWVFEVYAGTETLRNQVIQGLGF